MEPLYARDDSATIPLLPIAQKPPQEDDSLQIVNRPMMERVFERVSEFDSSQEDAAGGGVEGAFETLCYSYVRLHEHMQWLDQPAVYRDSSILQFMTEDVALDVPTAGRYEPFYYVNLFPQDAADAICRPVAQSQNTFLVNKELDFVYTELLVEIILEHGLGCSADELTAMRDAALQRFNCRLRYLKRCDGLDEEDHAVAGGRLCPLCWVLYTRIDSAFYRKCCQRLTNSELIDYSKTLISLFDIEHLPFPLVLLLCGEYLRGDDGGGGGATNELVYTHTNQWVKVPIWFLDF